MRIRAHHLFCMKGFRGKGYSPYFVKHMAFVITSLAKGESIEVVIGPDEICSACPNLMDGACTLYGSKVDDMDAYIIATLGGTSDLPKTSKGIDNEIAKAFSRKKDIEPVCSGCRWQDDCSFFKSYKNK